MRTGDFFGEIAALSRMPRTATVFADSNKKYLSTDLMREEPVRDGYLSPDVELVGFQSLNRLCSMCAVYTEP